MTEERAREAVEHLQQAALQMIEAGRAFLDLAEELVKDPAPLIAAAAAAAEAAQSLARRSPHDGDGHEDPATSTPGAGFEPRVQHIRVS